MKRIIAMLGIISLMTAGALAQGEAGAVWLLINPGARFSGMGEVGAALADDAYASYWNPAGLGFLRGRELALTHVNWLPNLVSDIYYEFIGYRQFIRNVGTVGGNIILLNLGEQQRTDEFGHDLGTFNSFMLAVTGSYGTALTRTSSIGVGVKMVHQHLTDQGAGKELGKGYSTNFCFDIAYLKHSFLTKNLTLGINMANIGPKIAFIDVNQADPMPTNMKLGLAYKLGNEYNKVTIAFDINKILVAAYPDRDIDGDEKVGGYDENGHAVPGGEYNKKGQREYAHSDEWYTGIFTSWVDDWLLMYDSATDGIGSADKDGNTNDGSLAAEFEKLTYNFGIEYWYSNLFALRAGCMYDKPGNITMKGKWPVPTFGAGLRWAGMGFDFGYTAGDPGHPRQNTMLFSMNIKF
ncbi:MAG: PorV/PorQ family protein [Candidatus Marinimicrobia bacterium]|nr:PorV/PorQ family protein [Candidatus Neomarinimicrobiota bacterium]HPA99261.1 PorV/PorQ family protein [Candidatus Neomarinimicrobiota bacterium]